METIQCSILLHDIFFMHCIYTLVYCLFFNKFSQTLCSQTVDFIFRAAEIDVNGNKFIFGLIVDSGISEGHVAFTSSQVKKKLFLFDDFIL